MTLSDPLQWLLRFPGGWGLLEHEGSQPSKTTHQSPLSHSGQTLTAHAALPSVFFFFLTAISWGTLLPKVLLVYLFDFLDFVRLKIH